MKKILAATVAVICTMAMFTACQNDDKAEIERLKAENEALKATQSTQAATENITTTAVQTEAESETTSVQTEAVSEITADNEWDATYKGCSIRFEGANLVYDYADNPTLVVEMTFRNDSDKSRSCGLTFSVDAYQNGIECDTAILWGETSDKYDTGTSITDIKPGVEFTVYEAYKLRDETSDVVVEVKGLYDFDSKILFTKTYTM